MTSNNNVENNSVNSMQNEIMLKTAIFKCTDARALAEAVRQLKSGNVISLPTDTVYGLACTANDPNAIKKLYDIKGRSVANPVAICVATVDDLKHWAKADHLPNALLNDLLPGALTVILHKSIHLNNPYLNRGIDKIAIRIPDFDFIRKVSQLYGQPIALTSANRSAEKSTLNIEEFNELWPQLGAVFDGGQLGQSEQQRAASTIVDLSEPGVYKITRSGVVYKQTKSVMEMFNIKNKDDLDQT